MRAEESEAAVDEEEEEEEEEKQSMWVMPPPRSPEPGIHLDGDKLDNLEEFYMEGVAGQGGQPDGFLRDLVLRSCYGTWTEKGWPLPSIKYTGENGNPCPTDYETAYENLKANIKEGKHYVGQDDGQGWTWLVAGQNPGGLYLYTMKSPPFGERPLALIKQDNPDEFFAKVDWHRLFVRLHKWQLWGAKAKDFPYPVKGQDFVLQG